MKRLSLLLLLFVIFSVASCDWLMQDSDKNSADETSEVGKADEANEEPPGDGVPSY